MENFLIFLIKNSNIVSEIWNFFYSIQKQLKKIGIIIKDIKVKYNFRIYFDLKKIDKNSLAVKYNVDGISFSILEKNFTPEIILLKNDKIIYVDEIFKNSKQLNNLFISTELLKEIFKLIGFKPIKNVTNNYNMFEEHFKILKNHEKIIYYNIQLEKKLIDKFKTIKNNFIYDSSKKIDKFLLKKNELTIRYKTLYENENEKTQIKIKTLYYLDQLNIEIENLKCLMVKTEKDFIFDTIKFEKILFLKNIPLENNYILIANKIHEYFKYETINNLSYQIKNFIYFYF